VHIIVEQRARHILGLPWDDLVSIFNIGDPPTTYEKRASKVNSMLERIDGETKYAPGSLALNVLYDGQSLIDLLKADDFDVVKIDAVLAKIKAKQEAMDCATHSTTGAVKESTIDDLTRQV